jgi:hypothetical protein
MLLQCEPRVEGFPESIRLSSSLVGSYLLSLSSGKERRWDCVFFCFSDFPNHYRATLIVVPDCNYVVCFEYHDIKVVQSRLSEFLVNVYGSPYSRRAIV